MWDALFPLFLHMLYFSMDWVRLELLPEPWIHAHLFGLIFQGGFYAVFVCGIRNFRVWYGPLPLLICQTYSILAKMTITFTMLIVVFMTFAKFMFICVWKSMRQMNEKLLARIALLQALLLSTLYSVSKLQKQVSVIRNKDTKIISWL